MPFYEVVPMFVDLAMLAEQVLLAEQARVYHPHAHREIIVSVFMRSS
jgi:hypothetical protein